MPSRSVLQGAAEIVDRQIRSLGGSLSPRFNFSIGFYGRVALDPRLRASHRRAHRPQRNGRKENDRMARNCLLDEDKVGRNVPAEPFAAGGATR